MGLSNDGPSKVSFLEEVRPVQAQRGYAHQAKGAVVATAQRYLPHIRRQSCTSASTLLPSSVASSCLVLRFPSLRSFALCLATSLRTRKKGGSCLISQHHKYPRSRPVVVIARQGEKENIHTFRRHPGTAAASSALSLTDVICISKTPICSQQTTGSPHTGLVGRRSSAEY